MLIIHFIVHKINTPILEPQILNLLRYGYFFIIDIMNQAKIFMK